MLALRVINEGCEKMASNKVIFITSDVIYAMETVHSRGTIKVLKEIRLPIKQGVFANGLIIDIPAFTSYLKNIVSLNKTFARDVTVVVDSSSIITKKVDVPEKIRGDMVHGIAKKELAYADDLDLVFDTCLISEDSGTKAYCCALEKKIVQQYNTAFEDAGIQINRIDVPLSTILNFTYTSDDFKNMNYILNIVEEDILYSVIFERGNYIFSTRDRIYEQVGTEDYNLFMLRKVDSLVSYFNNNSTEAIDTLKNIYFYGIPNDTIKEINNLYYSEGGSQVIPLEINLIYDPKSRIDVSVLGINEDAIREVGYHNLPFYLFTCGDKLGLNLLESIEMGLGTRLTSKQKAVVYGIPIGGAVITLLVLLFLGVRILLINNEMTELQNIMNSEEYIKSYNAAVGTFKLSNDLNVKYKNLTTFENEIYCEKVRTDIVEQIINCVPFNVYISQLSYTTKENCIMISGYSDSEMGPANFVKTLKDLECFESIEYNARRISKGYSFNLQLYIGMGKASEEDENIWQWGLSGDMKETSSAARPDPVIEITETTGNIWELQTPDGIVYITSQEDVNNIRTRFPDIDFGTILQEGGFN